MKIVSSRFERAASRPEDEPRAAGPDIVFAGRSNVGKSSLINRLLGVKGLARTSSSPGRTQSVNFYRVNDSCYFVDLPGYGYAKVPLAVRESWKPMIEGFLERRCPRIALAFLVVDSRRSTTDLDLTMRDWFVAMGIPHVVAATKSDKLSSSARLAAGRELSMGFGDAAGKPLVMVSVQTGRGIQEIWRYLDSALKTYRDRK